MELLAGGEVFRNFEDRNICKDGSLRWLYALLKTICKHTYFPNNPRPFIHSPHRSGHVQQACSVGRNPNPCPPVA